jgi:integrase
MVSPELPPELPGITGIPVLKGFISWCRKHGYLTINPLQNLAHIAHQPETDWRALNFDEISQLLQHCKPDRRLLYEIALCTGLRVGEIAALRVRHLDLEGSCLRPETSAVKNRRKTVQPIPRALADRLAFHIKGKSADAPLVFVSGHYDENFVLDLRRASIKRQTPAGQAVFHSLRKSYTTLLQEMSGASLVEAQKLTRHSDPRLTANTYTKTGGARLQSLVDSFGAQILA